MQTQTLTLEGVKKAARKAYRAKLLTAQHPVPSKRRCVYEAGKYHCVVGAALNKTALKKVHAVDYNSGFGVESLIRATIIDIEDDLCLIEELQNLHDEWARTSQNNGASAKSTIEERNKFLEGIGIYA